MALGGRGVARIDFKMDARGRFYFLECNPLPGLTPGGSDLVLIAQGAGMDHRALIGHILRASRPLAGAAPTGAPRRYKEREQSRRDAADLSPQAANGNGNGNGSGLHGP